MSCYFFFVMLLHTFENRLCKLFINTHYMKTYVNSNKCLVHLYGRNCISIEYEKKKNNEK